jgi:hypothetical protein
MQNKIVNKTKTNVKVCLSDCDVISIILNYLVPIFQYLSIKMTDYNMKLKTTKCLNTAVMLVYILGGEKHIKDKVSFCDTDNISKRYNKLKSNEKKMQRKKNILDKLDTDLNNSRINSRYFYYILLTHTEMLNKENKKSWFPGHVFIIEKSKDCNKKLKYKIFQSYINKYDLNGHFINNNETMEIKNIKYVINGIKNILLKKTWNKKAVSFWKKLCHVNTPELIGHETKNINICYKKIKIDNCYTNLLKFTDNALNEINKNIQKNNITFYNVIQEESPVKVKSFDIYSLRDMFLKLKTEIMLPSN